MDCALRMRGIGKRFGATVALAEVDLDAAAGEVHAIIGENGAGKSTLMKILAGALRPDRGVMELAGEDFHPATPAAARAAGVAMIYQELTLAPHLSVAENMMLGFEPRRWGLVDRRRLHSRVREVLELLDHPEIAPGERLGRLRISAQQLVEVGRALCAEARVIIFDEPTSSLTRRDTERLFAVIRRLRERGVAVLYISHFLEELREISDAYTVLRDGRAVARGRMAGAGLEPIIQAMVGRAVGELFPRSPRSAGEVALRVEGLSGARAPEGAGLELRRGEILGIFGLVGSGRTELLRAIYGLDMVRAGKIRVAGADLSRRSPGAAIRAGLGFLSENRKEEGLFLGLSLADNLTLGDPRKVAARGFIAPRRQRQAATGLIESLGIKALGPAQRVGRLSGGNQQKVAIGRLLHQDADIFLLDEPTRGVDVGSKAQIYALLDRLAAAGKSLLFVSSYLPELLGVCDRIAVMARGKLGRARPVAELDPESILRLATLGEEAA